VTTITAFLRGLPLLQLLSNIRASEHIVFSCSNKIAFNQTALTTSIIEVGAVFTFNRYEKQAIVSRLQFGCDLPATGSHLHIGVDRLQMWSWRVPLLPELLCWAVVG